MTDGSQEDFAKQYTPMTDVELMDVARSYEELMDPAKAALREEFKQRGLEPPLIEDAEYVVEPEEQEWVTVARYRDMPEAFVARSILQSAGIECVLRDENMVRMDWLFSNLIGNMRLQVQKQDEVEAIALLEEPEPPSIPFEKDSEFRQPVCPRCASTDIVLNDPGRRAAAISAATIYFFGIPVPFWRIRKKETWRCLRCNCRWSDPIAAGDQPLG